MRPAGVAWLTAAEAAVYVGCVRPDGTPNLPSFYVWKHRHQPKAYRRRGGRKLRFRQVDLDACFERDQEMPTLRVVGGRG